MKGECGRAEALCSHDPLVQCERAKEEDGRGVVNPCPGREEERYRSVAGKDWKRRPGSEAAGHAV